MRLELGQWIARPLGRNFLFRFVALRVLEAVTFQAGNGEAQQRRRAFAPDVTNSFLHEPRRLVRIGAVPVEDGQPGEAGEVRSNILAGCLIFRRNRDAVAIILDVNEQRQLLSRGNG